MGFHAEGTSEIQDSNENPYDQPDPKLVRASVVETYAGDIVGEMATQYLMAYLHDGAARYTGQARLTGRIGEREGTFGMHDSGAYVGGNTARGALAILPGSGTGELEGLRGEGFYVATHGEAPVESQTAPGRRPLTGLLGTFWTTVSTDLSTMC